LLAEDASPEDVETIDGTPMSADEIEHMLERTVAPGAPGAGSEDDDFRISLAGVQEKTALLWHDGNWILRLPQEDFCQVLGKPSHLRYGSDGGPGMVDIAAALRQSERPDDDLKTFLTAQLGRTGRARRTSA
jgi:serine/threonine protein kinase HipA of HipAB toxin-antitoxin module